MSTDVSKFMYIQVTKSVPIAVFSKFSFFDLPEKCHLWEFPLCVYSIHSFSLCDSKGNDAVSVNHV